LSEQESKKDGLQSLNATELSEVDENREVFPDLTGLLAPRPSK